MRFYFILMAGFVLSYIINSSQISFAYSPSFTRQELTDTKNYVYGSCYTHGIAGLSPFKDFPGFNLGAISLISNGKVLNATLWPTMGFVNPKAYSSYAGSLEVLGMDSKNESAAKELIKNIFYFYNKTYLPENYNTNITNGHRVYYGKYAGDFNHDGVFDELIQYWITYNNKSYLFMYIAPSYIFVNDSKNVSDFFKSIQVSGQKLIEGGQSSSIPHKSANFENSTYPLTIQYPLTWTLHRYVHNANPLYSSTELAREARLKDDFIPSVIIGADKAFIDKFANITVQSIINYTRIAHFSSAPHLPPWNRIQYGMFIDVPSSYGNGTDYSVLLDWKADTKNWTEEVNELSSTGHTKILNETKNYKVSDVPYVPLYFDLKYANYPQQYNLIFQTLFVSESGAMEPCQAYDISSWLAVPPPEFSMTISNNPLKIREDESKTIQLQVESKTNLNSNINLTIHKPKAVSADLDASHFSLQPNATGVTDLVVRVERNTGSRAFTIPIDAKMYFPFKQSVSNSPGKISTFNNTFSAYVNKHADLTVIVEPPLRWDERLTNFVQSIIAPISGIWGLIAGVGVVIGPLILRAYRKGIKKK